MATYSAPDVYVVEVSGGARPIQAVGTSTAGFVGLAPRKKARLGEAVAVNNWGEFVREYIQEGDHMNPSTPLSMAVYGFFQNGGSRCYVVNLGQDGAPVMNTEAGGLGYLEEIDEIAIVAAPGYTDAGTYEALREHVELLKDRVAILDAPSRVDDIRLLLQTATESASGESEEGQRGFKGPASSYLAYYYPWITVRDPLSPTERINVPPSGHIAGIWSRTDATRGVHKAPANETVRGALNLTARLSRAELGELNQAGVNCLRYFTREGIRVWGARTLDETGEWRYLNVRRLFNMVRESIQESTRWVVFEPNDYTLWKSIRRDIGAFLTGLWRNGALMGRTPDEAFFVKCDEETNPPDVIDQGQVVTEIGIAPVKPAEFIIFRIQQHQPGAEPVTQGGRG
jgi:uncharacterized protein